MRNALLIASMLLSGCSVLHASALKTGRLVVTLTDKETGGPITNATVTVRSCIVSSLGPTLDSHYRNTSAQANSNGIADVEFEFQSNMFDWWVSSPTHHCAGSRSPYEHFNAVVVPSAYTHINTNTVEGLAKYNELKALHESDNVEDYISLVHNVVPQSVTNTNNVRYRGASFYPKHNPRPMYSLNGNSLRLVLPHKETLITTNGVTVTQYPTVEVDLKKGAFLPPHCGEGITGETADFKLERFSVATNGVKTFYGWLKFAPGCGAYKGMLTGDNSFPSTYQADVNRDYTNILFFSSSRDCTTKRVLNFSTPMGKGEYLVLRTRFTRGENGTPDAWNYSKVIGPIAINNWLLYCQSVFNPTPNDPNLEFDTSQNLADEGRRENRWP